MVHSTGVWLQFKAFCMTAPIALALAFTGGVWLARVAPLRPMRLIPLGAGAALALGVLYGNALQYHATPISDYSRYVDLKRVDKEFAGQGPALFPNFDEYGEYILRDARGSGLVNPWHSLLRYNRTATPGLQTIRDTDEFDQSFLQGFRLIIRRRDPTASRPPSDFRLATVTREYEVWRRVGDPRTIAAHYPLKNRPGERTASLCRRVGVTAAQVGPGARIAYAVPKAGLVGVAAGHPGWEQRGGVLLATSPGRLEQDFDVPTAGRYQLSLLGSIGRKVTVSVDGRRIAALRWRESYPGQFMPLAAIRLSQGSHRLAIERGGGSLLPGTGNDPQGTTRTIGPLLLDPTFQRETVRTAPASRAGALCRSDTRMDWLEVLRPAAR
jgi:hypothetical protein